MSKINCSLNLYSINASPVLYLAPDAWYIIALRVLHWQFVADSALTDMTRL